MQCHAQYQYRHSYLLMNQRTDEYLRPYHPLVSNSRSAWEVLAKDREIAHNKVLDGDGLFIGYIINSYNQYSKKPIKSNEEWNAKITIYIKKY